MFWVFGDSWAEGYGLKKNEKNFSNWIQEFTGERVANYGKAASSLGHITFDVLKHSNSFSVGDTLIVVTPPDVRWYDIKSKTQCTSLFEGMTKYDEFLEDKTVEWFTYHHNLFGMTIVNKAIQRGMKVVLMRNFGSLHLWDWAEDIILRHTLNKEQSLTEMLTDNKFNLSSGLVEQGFKINQFKEIPHPNFIPGDNHPNETGHKIIARKVLDFLK